MNANPYFIYLWAALSRIFFLSASFSCVDKQQRESTYYFVVHYILHLCEEDWCQPVQYLVSRVVQEDKNTYHIETNSATQWSFSATAPPASWSCGASFGWLSWQCNSNLFVHLKPLQEIKLQKQKWCVRRCFLTGYLEWW